MNDLKNIIREYVEEAIDYRKIHHITSYSNPLTYLMPLNLYEGLIHTYPAEKTAEYVKSYFRLDDRMVQIDEAEDGIKYVLVRVFNCLDNVKLVIKAMDLCGYFLGAPKEDSIKPLEWVWLQFEPKIQKDYSTELRREERYLYHITPMYNLRSIQAIGLSPRCKNELFSYPARLYFLRGSSGKDEAIFIGEQLFKSNSSRGNNGQYALLTINLEKIPEDVQFYLDGNYPKGVFTTRNLSPDVIEKIETIEYKKDDETES